MFLGRVFGVGVFGWVRVRVWLGCAFGWLGGLGVIWGWFG